MRKLRSTPAAPLSATEKLEKACALAIRLNGKVHKAATMCGIDRRTLRRFVNIDFTEQIMQACN